MNGLRRLYKPILFVLVLALTLKIGVSYAVKKHINNILEANDDYLGQVGEVDISFFGTAWKIKDLNLSSSGDSDKIKVRFAEMTLQGVNLYKLIFKNELQLKHLEVHNPELYLREVAEDEEIRQKIKLPFKNFETSNFSLSNGKFLKLEKEIDTLVSFQMPSLTLSNISIDEDGEFNFISADQLEALRVNNLFLKLNNFENFRTTTIQIKQEQATIENLTIKTRYGKEELSSKITTERDYFDLRLDKLLLDGLDYAFIKGSPEIAIASTKINNFSFEAYRDKLVTDDLSTKSFYGEMLRSIPYNIKLDTISLKNGKLIYSEKINPNLKPSKLRFTNLEGKISNLSNYRNEEIVTELKANLMGEAPISIKYAVNPTLVNDDFLVSGDIKNFDAAIIDEFLRTTVQATAKGKVEQMYFTFSGNKNGALGETKMKYKDFKLEILKKDLLKINKVLSFLGNLLVNDGSNNDEHGYRYGRIDAKPDVTKSFPNYVWVCIRDGMIQTKTVNGKKE